MSETLQITDKREKDVIATAAARCLYAPTTRPAEREALGPLWASRDYRGMADVSDVVFCALVNHLLGEIQAQCRRGTS